MLLPGRLQFVYREPYSDDPYSTSATNGLDLSTLLTIRTLQHHALHLQAQSLSPTFQYTLNKFIKGSVTQVTSGALAYSQLQHTQAAESARALRQKGRTRRYVQKGGVMYAAEDRSIAQQRTLAQERKLEEQAKKRHRSLHKGTMKELRKDQKKLRAKLDSAARKRAKEVQVYINQSFFIDAIL